MPRKLLYKDLTYADWMKASARDEGKEEFSLIKSAFLRAAENTLAEKTFLWDEERKKLEKLIAECNLNKTTPPADYWHAENNARGVMHNAQFFLDVVKDTIYEYREQKEKRRERG